MIRARLLRMLLAATLLAWAALTRAAEPPPAGSTNLPVLTTAQQVLELGLEVARVVPHPVRLQGLVTYPEPNAGMIYVQDGSAGVRVVYTNSNYQPASGQMVQVEGIASAGMFAPFVGSARVRILGSSAIPEPCEAPAARMAAG